MSDTGHNPKPRAASPETPPPGEAPFDEALSAYLDGELSGDERAAVERRLAEEPAAGETLEAWRRLSGDLRALPRQTPPAALREAVLEEVDRRRRGERPRGWLPLGRSSRGWLWAGAAVAASLLIVLQYRAPEEEIGAIAKLAAEAAAPTRTEPPALTARPRGATGTTDAESLEEVAPSDAAAAEFDDLRGLASEVTPPPPPLSRSSSSSSPPLPSAPARVAAAAAPAPLMVARVGLRREAIEQDLVARVLADNQIAIERGDAPSDPAAGAKPDEEVLLIDAPAAQVAGFLEQLRVDALNCTTLSVELPTQRSDVSAISAGSAFDLVAEEAAADEAATQDGATRAAESPPEADTLTQWRQYNQRASGPAAPVTKSRRQQPGRAAPMPGQATRLGRGQLEGVTAVLRQAPSPGAAAHQSAATFGVAAGRWPSRRASRLPAPSDPTARVQALVLITCQPGVTGDALAQASEAADAEASPAEPAGPAAAPVAGGEVDASPQR